MTTKSPLQSIQTPNLLQERLARLKAEFPDLFTNEGQLNPAELLRLAGQQDLKHFSALALLEQRSAALKTHSIFGRVRSMDDLRCFMSWHVFAVWDFMSLVKRLQHEFTSVTLPWVPPTRPSAARLLNEIVLGEESDMTPDGFHASHFDLYLSAMREVGANTSQIEHFVDLVRSNIAVDVALRMVKTPDAVQKFVLTTIESAKNGSVLAVLGSFLYGREDAIPQMFKTLLADWSVPREETPTFIYYLQRHIELDGESHGPAATRLADDLTQGNTDSLDQIRRAGILAIEHRLALWDALQSELVRRQELAYGA
jgi:hypothetical protein